MINMSIHKIPCSLGTGLNTLLFYTFMLVWKQFQPDWKTAKVNGLSSLPVFPPSVIDNNCSHISFHEWGGLSVQAAFRAHRCSCNEPLLGSGHPYLSTAKGCCQHESILQKPSRSVQTAQLCPLLLRQPLSWAMHLTTASSSSSACQGLASLAPLLYPWCSLLWTFCLAMLCLAPTDPTRLCCAPCFWWP